MINVRPSASEDQPNISVKNNKRTNSLTGLMRKQQTTKWEQPKETFESPGYSMKQNLNSLNYNRDFNSLKNECEHVTLKMFI